MEKMKDDMVIWKVFIPSNLLNREDGVMDGTVVEEKQIICIKNIHESVKETAIGLWQSSIDSSRKPKHPLKGPWVLVRITEESVLQCVWFVDSHERPDIGINCILYDPVDLLSSYIFTNQIFAVKSENCKNQNSVAYLHDNISTVVSCLLKTYETSDNEMAAISYNVTTNGLFYICCITAFYPFIFVFLLFGKVLDNRFTRSGFAKSVLDSPALTRQLRHRTADLRNSLIHKDDSPLYGLRFLDACGRQMVDSLLGVGVLYILLNASLVELTATSIMDWADGVAASLTDLIHWMMGAPAGLKLNSQLTHFLGHFFLYHIYLWTGYLSLLRPVLGVVLKYSSVLGVVGVSAQLCLVQDIISMMTVHIYCFYVYAARLYSIQVYGLSSLWRLFRGKKWNVLRHRVDSAMYDIDQLFVGTLFFTILLFLLPTTLLYYVFFLALRLVVLVTEGILSFVIRLINNLQIYTIIMWALRSTTVAGDVLFTVVPNSATKSCLVLTMKPTQVPLSQLLREVRVAAVPTSTSDSLGTLIHKILKGQLIYPWIDSDGKSTEKVE